MRYRSLFPAKGKPRLPVSAQDAANKMDGQDAKDARRKKRKRQKRQ
jgi:hypothetical protein